MLIEQKTCKQCKKTQPRTLYCPSKNSDDGLFPICDPCINRNRDEQIAYWEHYHAGYQPINRPAVQTNF